MFRDLALWPHLTVSDNLEFVLGSADVSPSDRPWRAQHALNLVRIEQLGGRYPHQLSGGEQQRGIGPGTCRAASHPAAR